MNRFEATIEWANRLAALGVRNQEIRISVSLGEWAAWLDDVAALRRFGVEVDDDRDEIAAALRFCGPAGVWFRISTPITEKP